MKGGPVGRPPLPEGERTEKLSVSLPAPLASFLRTLANRSAFVAEAVAEKMKRDGDKKSA